MKLPVIVYCTVLLNILPKGIHGVSEIFHGEGLLDPPPEEMYDEESEKYFRSLVSQRSRAPSSYSSKSLGLVSEVKDQNLCGSCAAFATIAAVETCFKKITNVFGDYSEQQLIDCGYGKYHASACSGAPIHSYARWAAETRLGLAHESQYPYLDETPKLYCPANIPVYNQGAHISGVYHTYRGNEEQMKELVFKHGAVIAGMYASLTAFEVDYKGGIFDGCPPGERIDHAVTVVGYGTEGGVDYWLAKNSWGKNWGEEGYFRIKRGVNMCGIGRDLAVVKCSRTPGSTDPPLTTAKPCYNTYSNCDYLARTSCYKSHIAEKCPKACGLCDGMTPVPSNTCYNEFSNCDDLARTSCFRSHIAAGCKKACGLCDGMTPVPSNTCYNVWTNCYDYPRTSCKDPFVAKNCSKACRLCS